MRVAIIDMGGANLASLKNALIRLGVDVFVTTSAADIQEADRVILPGVGHAGHAMERLASLSLIDSIRSTQKKVLGICLGMQILFDYLEEGRVMGLGILPGRVCLLEAKSNFRVPNMGWAQLQIQEGQASYLLQGIESDAYFYFTHSYACPQVAQVRALTRDKYPVSAILEHENFFATQFHPEKSGPAGVRLLSNFLYQ